MGNLAVIIETKIIFNSQTQVFEDFSNFKFGDFFCKIDKIKGKYLAKLR